LEFLWDRAWERGMGWSRGYGEKNFKEMNKFTYYLGASHIPNIIAL
jgi:hypothetical protein